MDTIATRGREWFDRGVAAMSEGDLLLSISCFSRGIFLEPTIATLYAHRAEAYLRLCDFQSAILNLQRAFTLAPKDGDIRERLGQMHFLQGRIRLDECGGEKATLNNGGTIALSYDDSSAASFLNGGGSNDSSISSSSSSAPYLLAVRSFTSALSFSPSNTSYFLYRVRAWISGKKYGRAVGELNWWIEKMRKRVEKMVEDGEDGNEPIHEEEKDNSNGTRLSSSSPPPPPTSLDDCDDDIPISYDGDSNNSTTASSTSASSPIFSPPCVILLRAPSLSTLSSRLIQSLLLRAKLLILLDRCDLALRDVLCAQSISQTKEGMTLLQSLSIKGDTYYSQAIAYKLSNNLPSALSAIDRSIELSPFSIKSYLLRSSLLRELRRYDDALRDIKYGLKMVYERKGRRREEWRKERRRVREVERAKEKEERRQNGMDDETSNQDGNTFFTTNTLTDEQEHDDQLEQERLLLLEGKDEDEKQLELALALTLNGLGVQYFQSGHPSHGISCLTKAISLSPSHSQFYLNRGDCYLALQEEMCAMQDYEMVERVEMNTIMNNLNTNNTINGKPILTPITLSARRKIGVIHSERGKELFNRGSYEQALVSFNSSLVSDPSSSHHYLLRARTHHILHHYEQAYSDCTRSVELDPMNGAARKFLSELRAFLLRPEECARLNKMDEEQRIFSGRMHGGGNQLQRKQQSLFNDASLQQRMNLSTTTSSSFNLLTAYSAASSTQRNSFVTIKTGSGKNRRRV